MVCSILPRGQNHFPGSRLSRSFLENFNLTANEVNEALRKVETMLHWMKFSEIPGFLSASGKLQFCEIYNDAEGLYELIYEEKKSSDFLIP